MERMPRQTKRFDRPVGMQSTANDWVACVRALPFELLSPAVTIVCWSIGVEHQAVTVEIDSPRNYGLWIAWVWGVNVTSDLFCFSTSRESCDILAMIAIDKRYSFNRIGLRSKSSKDKEFFQKFWFDFSVSLCVFEYEMNIVGRALHTTVSLTNEIN